MSVLEKILDVLPLSEERRRHQRVKVELLGRYMLPDGREYPCQVTNMSPGGMALMAPVAGKPGDRVVAYVDHVGRLEGTIVRVVPSGFAMTIAATPRKREKLAAQLTWLANRELLGAADDRRHDRIAPKNPRSTLKLPNGIVLTCRVIDISVSGAAVFAETIPPTGTPVVLGKTHGRVVRHLDEGFAVEFSRLQHPDFLEDNVTGP